MSGQHGPIPVFDAMKALAFVGDLSMGQPTDHSLRTAWLAGRLAHAAGLGAEAARPAREAALIRWSGCTANAPDFAALLGDDVGSRAAMLAGRTDWAAPLDAHGGAANAIRPLAEIHCEVSGEVAALLALSDATQAILRNIFESWDGNGEPRRLAGADVPPGVFAVALASDLEIFGRLYGEAGARELIARRRGSAYPAELARLALDEGAAWIVELDAASPAELSDALATPDMARTVAPELLADVVDLKLPWMTGYSRTVAQTAAGCAARLSCAPAEVETLYRAGLIHGIGRAAVPNPLWDTAGPLPDAAWEKIRLVPYWTARAGKQTASLARAAELGSHAYERGDGSGYFRSLERGALSLEARILAAAVAWVALRARRPWREALPEADAAALLRAEAAQGRFDAEVVEALVSGRPDATSARRAQAAGDLLSAREIDVLRAISLGRSNKEVARELALSPSTVRTHVEHIFRKLGCTTRAAATLKASAQGWL